MHSFKRRIQKIILHFQKINRLKKIKNHLKTMPNNPLKSAELYLYKKYTIVNTESEFNMKNIQLELNKEYFEMRHRTSLKAALSIIVNNAMYGTDGNNGAHFEPLNGSFNRSVKDEVILYFKWYGRQDNVYASHRDKEVENILVHVSKYDYSLIDETNLKNYWESRLYPGTNKNLHLIGISTFYSPSNMLKFNKPIPISIYHKNDKNNHSKYYLKINDLDEISI